MVKDLPAMQEIIRDVGSVPGSGRSPGKRNGYPFQYSCLENSTDRGAWQAIVRGITKCPVNWFETLTLSAQQFRDFLQKICCCRSNPHHRKSVTEEEDG